MDDAAPPPPELLDVGLVAAESVKRYAAQRVPVTVEVTSTPLALVNRDAVRRVLANLLDNAVRYAASAVVVASALGRTAECSFR